MATLNLFLLGPPRLEREGQPIDIGRRKAIALLAYLAVTGQAHSREALATLFWPEADQSRGRATLRRVLSDLNKALGETWLETEGETIALGQPDQIWLDVAAFQSRLAALSSQNGNGRLSSLVEAVALYRDDFLAGFTLPDSPEFDDWQFFQTEALRRELGEALAQLVEHYSETEAFEAAITHARRWLALDPLLEAPHRALMRLYTWTGQRNAALRQYQECVRILAEQLDVEPVEETTALYERIRRGEEKEQGSKGTEDPFNQARDTQGSGPGDETRNIGVQNEAPAELNRSSRSPFDTTHGAHRPDGRQDRLTAPGVARSGGRPQPGDEAAAELWQSSALDSALTPSGELRPVTVLFAGLSQTTEALWDLAPEDMAAATTTLRQIVSGVIVPYQARLEHAGSDGVQVVFGLPQLHEDDPTRAIQAALEIRNAAEQQQLQVSIGISTGQIYFNPGDNFDVQEVVAVGPVVNLAARLQSVAETGQLLVSAATYAQTRRAFNFQPQSVSLGRGGSVEVYLARQALPRLEPVRGLEEMQTALVGREAELAQLQEALETVQQGQGRVITLTGEAGLGKSRLVAELKQLALGSAGPPLRWLEGRCLEFRRETGYWPFIDLLQDYLGVFLDSEPERSRCLEDTLAGMVSRGDLSPTRAEELKTYLGNLLSLEFEPGWDARLKNASREQIRYETFTGVRDFLVMLARQQPLALVFEDLHWADDLSLDLLLVLLESIPTSSLLLICTYRPEPDSKAQRLARLARQRYPDRLVDLRLRELSKNRSQQLVEALLGVTELPDTIQSLVVDRARGNPFFLEEAIRALIDAGILCCPDGVWQIRAEAGPVEVSPNVQSVILSRVDRLSPPLKQVLQHAAVMGRVFRPAVVAHTLSPAIDLASALWSLEEAALIYQERVVPEEEYSFKHALTQETVYQALSRQHRSEIHRRVAEAIEQRYADNLRAYFEPLAFHYDQTDRFDRAIDYIIKAGQKSCGAYLNDDAIHYFSKALNRVEAWSAPNPELGRQRLERRLSALTSLGETYHGMGRDTEAEQRLREAIAVGEQLEIPVPQMIRLYHWLCEVLHWQGRHEEQIALAETGLALLDEAAAESVEAVLMRQAMAIGHYNLGDFELYDEITQRTARFIEQLPYAEELRPAYLHITMAFYAKKDLERAIQWIEKLENLAAQHFDLRAMAEAHEHRWSPSFDSGNLNDPALDFDHIIELYTKIGDKSRLWRTLGSMVWTFLMRGDLVEARRHVDRELEVAQHLAQSDFIAEALVNRGVVLLNQGDWREAIASLEQAAEVSQVGQWGWIQWAANYCLGRVRLHQGERGLALDWFQKALALFEPYPWEEWRFHWWPFLSNILSGIDAALDDAQAFHSFCRTLPPPKQVQVVAALHEQWWLEPAEIAPLTRCAFEDRFAGALHPSWHWLDPFQDCAFEIENGLVIRAANGRDLWYLNRSAPRLLRPASGDFMIQTRLTLSDEPEDKPAMGGLLLWQDEQNFLRLAWGSRGPGELSFEGCCDNRDILIGRGRLPATAVWVRLERRGGQVQALASADGEQWFSVGQTAFPAQETIEVGLHAVGWIDRLLYPGAYSKGTATRFELFQMWNLN